MCILVRMKWFLQNLGKDLIRTDMQTTVYHGSKIAKAGPEYDKTPYKL